MNRKQIDKLNRYYAIEITCLNYQSVWQDNIPFSNSFNLFCSKIPLIEQNRDLQHTPTDWVTTSKDDKRLIATEMVSFLINRVQSFANATGNKELNSSVNFNASDFKRLRDADFAGPCNVVMTKVVANSAALSDFGVTEEIIANTQAAIDAFSNALTKPITVKSEIKTATTKLASLYKETDDIITNRLDLDIELFKTSNPEFYGEYQTAWKINSKSSRITMLMGYIEDAVSAEPLKNVIITFTLQGHPEITVEKKSSEKGNIRIHSFREGIYNLTVKKIGYNTLQQTVTVAKGETTTIDIKLVKI